MAPTPQQNAIPLLNFPTEMRQQTLLQIRSDQDIKDTIELKVHTVNFDSGIAAPQIPLNEATWHMKSIPIDRPTNPRVICSANTSTSTTSSLFVDFACRWNVPAPSIASDYQYIDTRWKEKQALFGPQLLAAWNEIFGP